MPSQRYFLVLLIFFKLSSLNVSRIYSSKNLPLWTWECVNDRCVPFKTKTSNQIQPLITCNMLCESANLWPQPTGPVALCRTAVPVCTKLFQLHIVSFPSSSVREHLSEAFDLFIDDLHKLENEAFGFEEWRNVAVQVAINRHGNIDPRMRLNTDESYNISIQPKYNTLIVNITSNSFCGARHGLETLSQLIWFDPYVGSLLMFESANVVDVPRYRYRGILLDTARNYFPVADLLRTIDAMATCKLNTFHWHVTDPQSFPMVLKSAPLLAQFGAYSQHSVYTNEDVRSVVQRARLRGIRVLLEVDVPSHVGSAWDWKPPDRSGKLHCTDKEPWNEYCYYPSCEELHLRNPHFYDILESVYKEILELTEVDDIFHLGGDYIFQECWSKSFNLSNPAELWLEFIRNALKRIESANGHLPNLTLLWSTHSNERIKIDLKEYVSNIGLQVRGAGWAQTHVSGVRTVISHEDAWDLNSGYGDWHDVSDGVPYNSWQRVYDYRPWPRGAGCIEGGEAMVWSSTLSADGLDSRLWPRATAFAERLWSDRPESATRPVVVRLDTHRSRLVTRGIRATPLWSMWCTHNPYTCN